LRHDVDLVVFVRLPAHTGDSVQTIDEQLYDTTREALPEVPLDLWSFMVVNHVRGEVDNKANTMDFLGTLRRSPISVVDAFVTDCTSKEEVLGAFDRMITYLLDSLDALDQRFLAARMQRLAEVREQLRLLIRSAGQLAQHAQPSREWHPTFVKLFEQTYDRLSQGLERLASDLRDERDLPDLELAEAVHEGCSPRHARTPASSGTRASSCGAIA
jgi:hypothetical protein